jgi:signal transduction histidine kinase
MSGADSAVALWSLFAAVVISIGVAVVALVAALILAQKRRRALQLSYAQRLLTAQEEERARVAREVHDDALQRVAMIRHEIETLRRDAAEPAAGDITHRLEGIAAEIGDLAVTLRTVAHELHPTHLGDVGLPKALHALAADFQRADGLTVELDIPDTELRLDPDAGLALYRITQEALRNVIRHARVGTARVSLVARDGHAVLTIRDEGAGFSMAMPRDREARGLGLTAMRERAGLARGTLQFASEPGKGTTIQVTVPRLP